MAVTLEEITADNWREVAWIAPRDEQREWVAALAAYYLLLSSREGLWRSIAICAADRVVGHIMWAVDPSDGTHWVGGLVIAATEQGRGYGHAAMEATIRYLRQEYGAETIKLSYHPANHAASRLYASLGFRPTGEMEGHEVVVARPAGPSTSDA